MSDYTDRDLRAWNEAVQQHNVALGAVSDELRRQRDFAAAVQTTQMFQAKKLLADVLSGQFGRRVVPRRPFSLLERGLGCLIAVYALRKAVIEC